MVDIVLRKDAIRLGLDKYFTGKPCKRGHITIRLTVNGDCYECLKLRMRTLYERNPQKFITRSRIYARDNPDKVRARGKSYAERNKEELRAYRKKHYDKNREKIIKRATDWGRLNKEAKRRATSMWEKKNPHKMLAKRNRRRAASLNAVGPWTDNDIIEALYAEAKRISIETGIAHDVDHIVPLVSPYVCGLHVSWNMQILTRAENAAKGNKIDGF